MASGDIKSEDAVVLKVQAGGVVAKGDLVHIEADGYWDQCASGDVGKFGVALDAAAAEGDYIEVGVEGDFEVKATAAAIKKGAYVIAGAGGLIVDAGTISETTVYGTIAGYVKTAFESSGQGILHLLG